MAFRSSTKNTKNNKLIVILGSTASGKSDLVVDLAKKFDGEIVSADSRQVYRGMNIGSGKITKKEMRGVTHHFLDVASPKRRFTVVQYQKLAQKAIKDIQKRGKIPVLCGGTGLYIQSIVDGLVIPEVPPDAKLRARLEKLNTDELFERLKKLDPRRAKNIDKHNRRRLIRALEIVIKTGKPVPSFSVIPARCPSEAFSRGGQAEIQRAIAERYNRLDPRFRGDNNSMNILQLGIAIPKDQLKARIKKRLLKRLKQGMVAEVKKLHRDGVSWKRLEEFGLEYRYVARYLQGKLAKQEMIDKLETEINQYAKRQMTWFKRDKRIKWIKNYREADKATKEFLQN
ncbi:MAG: tRNA (adenosine(37)-N6)-dimethylallyltransferase MiaA [Candidatus Portnoybacteria bacterium]|nr:tRNA (adenosine(37)-N6)-dimethylallyltransferase MiaA [Candidatus Portnoybacteria bacterium]